MPTPAMPTVGETADAAAAASIDPNEIDQILTNELYNLTVQDRESLNEEVHGVQCLAPAENPGMLQSSLKSLSTELDSIREKPAFNRSQELGRTYVNTADFRLRFLRAELFDVKKAATRLVNFLEFLMELFDGKEELLVRPFRVTDFAKSEMAILKAGNFQLLPYRDRSGRRVLTIVMNLSLAINFKLCVSLVRNTHMELDSKLRGLMVWLKTNVDCVCCGSTKLKYPFPLFVPHCLSIPKVKILLYTLLAASESVESQRKGYVQVMYPTHAMHGRALVHALPTPEDRKVAERMNKSMPIRMVAMHFCIPDSVISRLFRAMVLVSLSGSEGKFRLVTHTGSWTEWQYALMGYGIPVDLLPISSTGTVKTIMLQQWMRIRKAIETPLGQTTETTSDSDESSVVPLSAIECPNFNDVIFRPGKSYMCHPGNVMFRSLIESKMDEHFAATRSEKAVIAWWIVREVERKGGRFLRWDNRGWWTEFEDRSEIRYKIPTYFRDFTRNMKARRNRQIILSGNQQQAKQQQQKGCFGFT